MENQDLRCELHKADPSAFGGNNLLEHNSEKHYQKTLSTKADPRKYRQTDIYY
jgi:hypothetical protein